MHLRECRPQMQAMRCRGCDAPRYYGWAAPFLRAVDWRLGFCQGAKGPIASPRPAPKERRKKEAATIMGEKGRDEQAEQQHTIAAETWARRARPDR